MNHTLEHFNTGELVDSQTLLKRHGLDWRVQKKRLFRYNDFDTLAPVHRKYALSEDRQRQSIGSFV